MNYNIISGMPLSWYKQVVLEAQYVLNDTQMGQLIILAQ